MINVENVRASYGGEEVLKGITAVFAPGRVSVVIGPNGCGKSTLLKTMAGLLHKSAGEVRVLNKRLEEYSSMELARHVACLPQSRNVPEISAQRMVLHGRFPYLSWPRRYGKKDMEIAGQALVWAGADSLADQSLKELSGGQRQKVYIAMALAQDTDIVLMDEPTTYLDIKNQFEVLKLARRLADMGKTVVMVLHDLPGAMSCADEILLMDQGQAMMQGTPGDIYDSGLIEDCFGVKIKRSPVDGRQEYYCLPM